MDSQDLHARLNQLDHDLKAAEAHLNSGPERVSDHRDTAARLRKRYDTLTQEVRAEAADAETHGHHVSDLELSVRQWIDSLGLHRS